ncbi:MAG: hypothetical protein ACYDEQ_00065, partial [Desulfocucumaceae bacterium]
RRSLNQKISLEEITKMVIKKIGVPGEALLSLQGRARKNVMARNIVIYLAIKHEIVQRTGVMGILKLSPYQISRGYYAATQSEESLTIIAEIEEIIMQ